MSEQALRFFNDVLQRHYGAPPDPQARITREDLDWLVNGDAQRRVQVVRAAALRWARSEDVGTMAITSECLVTTSIGLFYAAELGGGALHFLAVPAASFEAIIDCARLAQQGRRSLVAVDSRLEQDLLFACPLDRPIRRLLEAKEVLRLAPARSAAAIR